MIRTRLSGRAATCLGVVTVTAAAAPAFAQGAEPPLLSPSSMLYIALVFGAGILLRVAPWFWQRLTDRPGGDVGADAPAPRGEEADSIPAPTFGRAGRIALAPAMAVPAAPAEPQAAADEKALLGEFTLLLDSEIHVDWDRIQQAMAVIDKDGGWTVVASPGGLGMAMGRCTIMMLFSHMPHPLTRVADALKRSPWYDGDLTRVGDHRHYLHLRIAAPERYEAKAQTAKAATIMIGLLTQLPQVAAVINEKTGTIFAPAQVHDLVGILHQDEVPIQLWTWTAPDSLEDGDVSLSTSGLEPFLGFEVELWNAPHPVEFVRRKVNGVLRYLLINGPVIGHGDVIGETPGDRSVRCFLGLSRAHRPEPVKAMFLEFDLPAAEPRPDRPPPPPLHPETLAPGIGVRSAAAAPPSQAAGPPRTFGRKTG
jgi:hypothetical protein